MKRSILIILFLSSIILIKSSAQSSDIGKFIATASESTADAEKLFKGYLSPYFNAFGTSLTGGWYNTAKPHQLGGFDLTVTVNTAFVPTSDRNFDVSELQLETFRSKDPTNTQTPTIAGEKNGGNMLVYNNPGTLLDGQDAFEMPDGTGFSYVPSPMLQLGLGLIKDTEVKGRYMPTFTSGDSKTDMWGIGVMHGLKQWIPFIKKVPVLHLSLQYGYTRLNSEIGMSVTPSDVNAIWSGTGVEPTWDNQKLEFVTHSHTANLLISANLPVVCFYGGVGFASTKTNLMLKGDYPTIDFAESASENNLAVTSALTNPFDIEFKNTDGSKVKPRYNIGMRLKFAVVTIHGDYTYANYGMFTFGLGISFR